MIDFTPATQEEGSNDYLTTNDEDKARSMRMSFQNTISGVLSQGQPMMNTQNSPLKPAETGRQ